MTTPQRFQSAPIAQGQKTIRGLREASIPVAAANTVLGLHRIQFVNRYQFGFFASPDVNSPGQFGSLIHNGISSRGIFQRDTAAGGTGYAAYFGAYATEPTSLDDEGAIAVNSPPDIAGQPVQNPLLGANKVSCSLWVQSPSMNVDNYTLSLYQAINPLDSADFMGAPANQSLLIAQWGPVFSAPDADNHPIFNFSEFVMPVATSWWFEIKNNVSDSRVNKLAGSIFFHG